MNIIMYYGGFAAAILLLIMAVLSFIVFKVPSIHRYFSRNSRKGLVQAEAGPARQKHKKAAGPKRVTRAEYDNLTEVIRVVEEVPAGTVPHNVAPGVADPTSATVVIRGEDGGKAGPQDNKTQLL